MAAAVETLLDVPAFSMKEIGDLATILVDKMIGQGYEEMNVDEQVELRLLRTLLDGYDE